MLRVQPITWLIYHFKWLSLLMTGDQGAVQRCKPLSWNLVTWTTEFLCTNKIKKHSATCEFSSPTYRCSGRFLLLCWISRRIISEEQIPELVRKVMETIFKKLETQSSVSLTTDLWSDCRLRSFLGVTAHVCSESKDFYAIESYLLNCRRFTGRHGIQ